MAVSYKKLWHIVYMAIEHYRPIVFVLIERDWEMA